MAEQQKKVSAPARQLTLLEVTTETEEVEEYTIFRTEFFEIKTRATALEKLHERLNSTNKRGKPNFTEEQKFEIKRQWVQSHMKLVTDKNVSGENYYVSKRSLAKQIFQLELA